MSKFWLKYPLINDDMSLNYSRIFMLAAVAGAWSAICIIGMSRIGWISMGGGYSETILLVLLCTAIAVLGGVFGSLRKNE